MSLPLEHDYIGLTEASLMEARPAKSPLSSSSSSSSSKVYSEPGKSDSSLNLKETELRLGLPGSKSPQRKPALSISIFGKEFESSVDTGNGSCLVSLKSPVSGAKRGFSDAISIDGSSVELALSVSNGSKVDLVKSTSCTRDVCLSASVKKDGVSVPPSANTAQEKKNQVSGAAPVAKAQVVGWPPIRSFRKNTMVSNQEKKNDNAEDKSEGCLYVKVSMDGAPYLRKVDLKTCKSYFELSSALEKMFSCFTIGQYGSSGIQGRERLSQSRLMDLLHGSEYVLTYEDKDGDWMLVGDVPWEMFTKTCRRLRIMKGSEAVGLAPRAMEKCKNRN